MEQVEKTKQVSLDDELKKEIGILQRLNLKEDYSYDEATLELYEGCKTLRLLCEGKLKEAGVLLISSAEKVWDKKQVEVLRIFLATARADNQDDQRFLADNVRAIYKARETKVQTEIKETEEIKEQ